MRRRLERFLPPRIELAAPGLAISGNLRAAVFRHCVVVYSDEVPASKITMHRMRGAMIYEAAPVLTQLLRERT
jgi:hypothetical protein